MEHLPYPKIPARLDPARVSPAGNWVATEKIHGANLVVGCDGARARIGKRKAWLEDDEPFFGWQLLRTELCAAAHGMLDALGAPVRLYGEIFGGAYPHADVAAMPGLSAVQSGIWYSPDIHFSVFDILVEDELLAHTEVEALAAAHGLLVAPLIARGPRAVVDALPTRMLSRVAGSFGLPALDGNFAEGLVLKPDARAVAGERVTIKRKIPELDDARFGEAVPFASDALLDGAELAAHAARLFNDARIASARSKVGTSAPAIRDEVVLDVLVDLEAAFPAAFRSLSTEDEKKLRAVVASLLPEREAKLVDEERLPAR